jgi:hypothetical protein
MRVNRTQVTVYENEIDAAFRSARGSVYQNMRFVAFGNVTIAQKIAPRRTGTMQRSIGYRIMPSGKYSFVYHMSVGTDYAIYTLEGTTGPIYPSNSKVLWVRPKPYSYFTKRTAMISVEGQTGHNWLAESVRGTFKVLRLN